jgi:uncharacterized sulfatase
VADNTLVAFIVDNGYVQLPGINWFDKRSKLSPYEPGVRTPILLRWPGHITPGRHDTLVHAVDLAPTILAACGVRPPSALPGLNLLDVVKGAPLTRDTIFGATFRFKAEKPVDPRDTVDYRWCMRGRWKLIGPRGPDASPELYDIVNDPHEQHNVAAEQPDRVRRLRETLDRWWPTAAKRAPGANEEPNHVDDADDAAPTDPLHAVLRGSPRGSRGGIRDQGRRHGSLFGRQHHGRGDLR